MSGSWPSACGPQSTCVRPVARPVPPVGGSPHVRPRRLRSDRHVQRRGHTVFANDVAASIGWPAGNPFQTEVGFANLAIGIVGFACFWRYDFWLPAIVAKSVFAWGAGLTHVLDIVRTGNLESNNAGPILVWDFLLPVVMVALYILARPARDRIVITPAMYRSTRWRLEADDRAHLAVPSLPRGRGLELPSRRGTNLRMRTAP